MNVDTVKIELIDWIARLKDPSSIREVLTLKKKLSAKKHSEKKIFGSGRHLIEYISEDFNEPLDDFKAYQK
jgi:hypothetical protein